MARHIRTLVSSLAPRRLWLGLVLLAALAGGWLIAMRGFSVTPAAVRAMLTDLGIWGPLALVLGLAALLVVPAVPASLFQMGAGLAFGPYLGLLAVTLADILGASLGFWIARNWGEALLGRWLAPATLLSLQRLAARMTWRSVMLLRLLPGPAYPLVSFAAGVAPLGFGAYLAGSLLGVLPALVLLVVVGDLVLNSPLLAFAVVVALVGSLALIGRMIGTHVLSNASDSPESTPPGS
jgi:uncharacterized membrane protein YdjX (TVP38/TMEM64 family)